mgnify:CR=1 FL=1
MARHSQRHRTQSLPFPHADDGLDFDFQAYRTDTGDWQTVDHEPGERGLDVAPDEETPPGEVWSTLEIDASVTLPEAVVDHVLPADERSAPPVTLYVAVRCHQTIYRDRVVIADAPVPAGEYKVTLELRRDNFKEEVELRPFLVRATDREDATQYASTRNVRLATAPPHRVAIDASASEAPPSIDGEAVSFGEHAHLPDGDELYHMDFRNEARPKLWLNADYPRITDVLQTRGSIGAAPRLRDVILDEISYPIWSQLIVRAGVAIDDDGSVPYDWQETVLETFGRGLTGRSNLEAAKRELRATVDDPKALPELMAAIDEELQSFIEPRAQLINLMEEGLQL